MAPRTRRRLTVLAVGALALLSPVNLRSFRFADEALTPFAMVAPGHPLWIPQQADLDGDGLPENLSLSSGSLAILSNGRLRWRSPTTWSVRQAAFTDLNQDGRLEVSLLVWRDFRPWPTDRLLPHAGRIDSFHDSAGQSCHLILIGADGRGGYRELWAGSALADPITLFAAVDLDQDGRQELLTLEGRYGDPPTSPARDLKVWKWDGFGFTSTVTVEARISRFVVIQSAGSTEVITQVNR